MVEKIKLMASHFGENTSYSFKVVTAVVSLAILVTGLHADLTHNLDRIFERLTDVEEAISSESRWTRTNMEHFVREAALMNPDVNFPDPADFVSKD